jgi:hypothetical protein
MHSDDEPKQTPVFLQFMVARSSRHVAVNLRHIGSAMSSGDDETYLMPLEISVKNSFAEVKAMLLAAGAKVVSCSDNAVRVERQGASPVTIPFEPK